MALEQWQWYLNKDDATKLPYFANTSDTLFALKKHTEDMYEIRKGGAFKRFIYKLFRIKPNVTAYQLENFYSKSKTKLNKLCIYFRLKYIPDPVIFIFNTHKSNLIEIKFGCDKASVEFKRHKCTVSNMYTFMEELAKFIYKHRSNNIKSLEIYVNAFLNEVVLAKK